MTTIPTAGQDLVVLLDTKHQPVGTASREGVHGTDTPLHLAFSCWLADHEDNLLLTRRALTKRSWPGVWTNSFCGHPRPEEGLTEAVSRYAQLELGVVVTAVEPLLPDFSYRAVDASGIVENEVCPVFTARLADDLTHDDLALNPDEVMEHHWVTPTELRAAIAAAPWALSPWLCSQAAQLEKRHGWSALQRERDDNDEETV